MNVLRPCSGSKMLGSPGLPAPPALLLGSFITASPHTRNHAWPRLVNQRGSSASQRPAVSHAPSFGIAKTLAVNGYFGLGLPGEFWCRWLASLRISPDPPKTGQYHCAEVLAPTYPCRGIRNFPR